jgi:hypothetical protein
MVWLAGKEFSTGMRDVEMSSVRIANLSHLNSLGFQVASSLPVNSGLPGLRPKKDIVMRLVALELLFSWVARPEQNLDGSMAKQVDDSLTAEEREIIALPRGEANEQFSNTIGWKLENIWPLAWTLGFDQKPDIDGKEITDETRDLILCDFMPAFETKWKLRSEAEVAELEDLFYCAHNAARSAQLGEPTVPEYFDPIFNGGVIHERRHSLTWCLSPGCSWEDTDLST